MSVVKNILCAATGLAWLAAPAGASEPAELLFVQSADSMRVHAGVLTLKNVSPSVVFFSDRPKRMAGHVEMSGFLKAWGEGKDSFADDPPNANLSIVGGGAIKNTVVELKNPRYDGTNLSYDIKVINGDLPSSGGTTALFIDGLFSGGGLLSGARGAGLGAIGGAIAGNAGAGAAIGAAVGVLGGAIKEQNQQSQYYQY